MKLNKIHLLLILCSSLLVSHLLLGSLKEGFSSKKEKPNSEGEYLSKKYGGDIDNSKDSEEENYKKILKNLHVETKKNGPITNNEFEKEIEDANKDELDEILRENEDTRGQFSYYDEDDHDAGNYNKKGSKHSKKPKKPKKKPKKPKKKGKNDSKHHSHGKHHSHDKHHSHGKHHSHDKHHSHHEKSYDDYILKTEIVPPVCPECPSYNPCSRCPENVLNCEQVPCKKRKRSNKKKHRITNKNDNHISNNKHISFPNIFPSFNNDSNMMGGNMGGNMMNRNVNNNNIMGNNNTSWVNPMSSIMSGDLTSSLHTKVDNGPMPVLSNFSTF